MTKNEELRNKHELKQAEHTGFGYISSLGLSTPLNQEMMIQLHIDENDCLE